MTPLQFDTARAPVLFIADLHLDPGRPAAMRAFCHFVETRVPAAAALFILGDLFEAWIGDDARPDKDPVAPALAALGAQGLPVYFMPGNRDFLVGPAFCRAAGITMLTEPTLIEIDGERVLLEHGDALCTDDTAYQAFRSQVRNPDWQAAFLAQPVAERLEQARALRQRSGEAMAGKSAAIMDVNAEAVRERLQAWGVGTLIHGHTHRPAIHRLDSGDGHGRRIVLGDWFEQGSVLRIDNGTARLETISFES